MVCLPNSLSGSRALSLRRQVLTQLTFPVACRKQHPRLPLQRMSASGSCHRLRRRAASSFSTWRGTQGERHWPFGGSMLESGVLSRVRDFESAAPTRSGTGRVCQVSRPGHVNQTRSVAGSCRYTAKPCCVKDSRRCVHPYEGAVNPRETGLGWIG